MKNPIRPERTESLVAKKPVLLIMAAGMGARYGGLKQITPVGPRKELILDYSLFDAKRAGFERAVIVIKRESEKDFDQWLGGRIARHLCVDYAYQEISRLPAGFCLPAGREKPWGTGHAVLAAREIIAEAPFCVVNADDFYGEEAFRLCYGHLSRMNEDNDFTMVGYLLKNTLSENGYVARGVCETDAHNRLAGVTEHTHIISTVDGPLSTEDRRTYTLLPPDAVVSMNMWGFPASMMALLEEAFPQFLRNMQDPLRDEFFLPTVVNRLLEAGKAIVTVRTTRDRWYGVTYRMDVPQIRTALRDMTKGRQYPKPLWR